MGKLYNKYKLLGRSVAQVKCSNQELVAVAGERACEIMSWKGMIGKVVDNTLSKIFMRYTYAEAMWFPSSMMLLYLHCPVSEAMGEYNCDMCKAVELVGDCDGADEIPMEELLRDEGFLGSSRSVGKLYFVAAGKTFNVAECYLIGDILIIKRDSRHNIDDGLVVQLINIKTGKSIAEEVCIRRYESLSKIICNGTYITILDTEQKRFRIIDCEENTVDEGDYIEAKGISKADFVSLVAETIITTELEEIHLLWDNYGEIVRKKLA